MPNAPSWTLAAVLTLGAAGIGAVLGYVKGDDDARVAAQHDLLHRVGSVPMSQEFTVVQRSLPCDAACVAQMNATRRERYARGFTINLPAHAATSANLVNLIAPALASTDGPLTAVRIKMTCRYVSAGAPIIRQFWIGGWYGDVQPRPDIAPAAWPAAAEDNLPVQENYFCPDAA